MQMIILTLAQATQVRGDYATNKGLDPRENPNNPDEYWLTPDVLMDEMVPQWIKDILNTCTQMDISPPVDVIE